MTEFFCCLGALLFLAFLLSPCIVAGLADEAMERMRLEE
jgi:hypothetical protein